MAARNASRPLDQTDDTPQASPSAPDPLPRLRPWLRKIQLRIVLFTVLFEPFLLLIKGRRRRRWRELLGRWAIYSRGTPSKTVWIHATGPGEMRVAIALVSALPQELSVVITSSSSGLWLGETVLGTRAEIVISPFPFGFVWRRFLRRYSPRQLILIEATDLIPVLCIRLMRRDLPTALINGWMAQKWIDRDPSLPLLHDFQILCVRSEVDRELFAGIGVPHHKISLTGEMKFDAVATSLPGVESRIQDLAGERPILIAGSTHPDEEPQILDAFERMGGGNRALLILAPRLRFKLTETLLRNRGVDFVQRTRLPRSGRPAVILLDQIGELASLYRLASAAFVGYSLSPRGRGHNPIEPARFAIPIAAGPNMASFRFHADLFDRAGAWQRVADADELARTWSAWLDDPELARRMGQRAADLVASQRGLATARTLAALRPFLGLPDSGAL